MKKLLEGSKEHIDVNMIPSDIVSRVSSLDSSTGSGSDHFKGVGLTYEEMQGVVENLLTESGYYTNPCTKVGTPLGPISSSAKGNESVR